jgi:hypothetical protein
MDENTLFYYCIESYALFRTELLIQRSGAIGAKGKRIQSENIFPIN